jgi:hypothetical protein
LTVRIDVDVDVASAIITVLRGGADWNFKWSVVVGSYCLELDIGGGVVVVVVRLFPR